MLELNHIYKYYNPGTVHEMCLFEDFGMKIERGDFVSVIGSNGSGKTSLSCDFVDQNGEKKEGERKCLN